MSRFKGKQGEGAKRTAKEQKRLEAEERKKERAAMSADEKLMVDLLRQREAQERND